MFGEGGLRWGSTIICAGRGMSSVNAASVAILLSIGSPVIARAATMDGVARCRAIYSHTQRWHCFKILNATKQNAPKAKAEDVPKAKSEDAPPASLRGVQETAPDDPTSTASIDRLSVAPGQPVCVDQDSLAAALVAGVLASDPAQATTMGCQTLPDDAQVEVLQRFPSGFQFLRIVKVKVTSHVQPEPSVGYTVEIGR